MPALTAFPLTAAVFTTLELLGAVTTPLIGLVIGYEVNLQRRGTRRTGPHDRRTAADLGDSRAWR